MALLSIHAKMVLLGSSSSGKSSLVIRFAKKQFFEYQEATIGASFMTETLKFDDQHVKLEIWDTAGQERYSSLAPMYYRGASLAVVCYDITRYDSFIRAKEWIAEVKQYCGDYIVIALSGNKSDLEDIREVSKEEAELYADDEHIIFMETSAKANYNVQKLFIDIAKQLPNSSQTVPAQHIIIHDNIPEGTHSKCC